MQLHEPDQAFYLYAVARAKEESGVSLPPTGGILPDVPLSTLGYKDLLAVVSPVPLAEFGLQVLRDKVQDLAWVQPKVLAHHRVLTGLMAGHTLVPLKFCTLYTSRERVLEVMARHYEALGSVLDRVAGATEVGVKVYCDRSKLLNWVWAHNEALKPVREKIARLPPGSAYVLRKSSAKKADEETQRTIDACTRRSHRHLAQGAREAATVSKSILARAEKGNRDIVFNGAYLVDEAELETFRTSVAGVEARYAALGFAYEITGPWPPYSFAQPELKDPNDEQTAAQ